MAVTEHVNVTINFGHTQTSSSSASQPSNSSRCFIILGTSNNATQPSAANNNSRPQTNASQQSNQPTR